MKDVRRHSSGRFQRAISSLDMVKVTPGAIDAQSRAFKVQNGRRGILLASISIGGVVEGGACLG